MSSLKKIAWSGFAVLLALVMSMGLMAQSAFAANEAITGVTITRASSVAAATTTYTVTFTNGTVGGANNTALTAGDTVTVDFVGAGGGAEIRTAGGSAFVPLSGFIGTCAASTVGTAADLGVLVVTLSAGCSVVNDAAGVSFTLSNITNGAVAAAASLGGVSTNGAVDDGTIGAASNTVATTAAPAGAVTGVSFVGASAAASTVTTWTQTFTATTALAAGGTVTTVFPAGFVIPNPSTTTLGGAFTSCTATSVTTGQSVVSTLAGGSCALAAGATGTVSLAGIVNPVAGTYAAAGFTIATSADVTAVANGAAVLIGAAVGTGSCSGLCVDAMVLMPPGSSTTCTTALINTATIVVNGGTTVGGPAGRPGQNPADGSVAAVVCAHIALSSTHSIDSNVTPLVLGADAAGLAVAWTSSVGYLSTGTSKTTTSVAGSSGWVGTNYRGAGNVIATDTVTVAVQGPTSAVGTLTINLTAGSGTNASKLAWQAPSVLAVAANITNTSPQYSSPTIGTNLALQVTDAAGLGVNNETVLLSTDKGFIVANPGFAILANANCTGAAAKSISLTTAGTNSLSPGGQLSPGSIDITFCGNQLDAPGKATLTAQNISTTMANGTATLAMAGRPGKLTATATGNAILATVTDKDGNNVADGTPVRFTISSNAGAVSVTNGCTTSTNGAASAVVALTAATGTVIVSADWNEGGTTATAATCAAAGSQQIAASVTVPGGSSTAGGTVAAGGTGALVSGSVPATGFGLIVFGGGTIAQLVTASGVGNTGALYATVGGIFVPYVPGTTIGAVNADFLAAFPGGNIPANTAFVGRK